MRSRLMIIGGVGFHLPAQMPFTENDNMIQALSPYRANQSFHIGRLPWRTRGSAHFFNAETLQSSLEYIAIDAVPITQ